jgi:hypothetical protein
VAGTGSSQGRTGPLLSYDRQGCQSSYSSHFCAGNVGKSQTQSATQCSKIVFEFIYNHWQHNKSKMIDCFTIPCQLNWA